MNINGFTQLNKTFLSATNGQRPSNKNRQGKGNKNIR